MWRVNRLEKGVKVMSGESQKHRGNLNENLQHYYYARAARASLEQREHAGKQSYSDCEDVTTTIRNGEKGMGEKQLSYYGHQLLSKT
jgi:hypothetical protein